jgi:MFS family permease
MLIVSFGLASMGYGAMFIHLIPYLTDSGYSSGQAAGAFSMIGVAGLISKPIWGLIVERVPTRFAAASEFAILGVGVILIVLAPTLALMYVAIFVLGLGIGGVVAVQEVIWADYYGRVTLGAVRSFGRSPLCSRGPVFAALANDLRDSYELAFICSVCARGCADSHTPAEVDAAGGGRRARAASPQLGAISC